MLSKSKENPSLLNSKFELKLIFRIIRKNK